MLEILHFQSQMSFDTKASRGISWWEHSADNASIVVQSPYGPPT